MRTSLRQERGFALIGLLIVLSMGLMFFAATLGNTRSGARNNITTEALAQAREALVAYAASRQNQPGVLPCPDTNNDGSTDTTGSDCTSYLGRLPWKTLGIPALRDAAGECLWYSLSPTFRSSLAPGSRAASEKLNLSLSGELTVLDATETALPAPTNPVIAVIFSPGSGLNAQDRSSGGSTTECGGNTTASNYLDISGTIDNSSGDTTVIAASQSATFNDQLTWITSAQLFDATSKRVLYTLRGNLANSIGLAYYFNQVGSYPYAASAGSGGASVPSNLSGLVPYTDLIAWGPYDSGTATWLSGNNWYPLVGYTTNASQSSATLTLGGLSVTCGNGPNACP